MKRRMISLFAALVGLLNLPDFVPASAITADQKNIVDWADYYYNTLWTCHADIAGWRGRYTFYEGQSYHLPYGQPVVSGAYIGYGIDLNEFLEATENSESEFYYLRSEYHDRYSTYYATDCSAFVSSCWGISRNTTYSIPDCASYLGMATYENLLKLLEPGDALNSATLRHVVLVTDLIYDEPGNLYCIEITEQTPPQLSRSYYTPEELAQKYGRDYGIYRYENSVPPAPQTDYLARCEYQPADGQVCLKVNTGIMSLPWGSQGEEGTLLLAIGMPQEFYAVTGIFVNTQNEKWYRVRTETGDVGYLKANAVGYFTAVTI